MEALLRFGVVNLDKPPGPSSHQVSAWVRQLSGVERAAHAGTLDPKVTGCLPVLLGDATRLAGTLLGRKEYVAVLETHAAIPADFEDVVAEFVGEIHQKPPRKSAVRRRLRTREIYGIDVLDRRSRSLLLEIACESGTYVRKLCHDIGLALGTGANMGDLRRTATEPFDDSSLVTMYDLIDALVYWEEGGDDRPLREVVHPAERAIEHLPRVTIAESAAQEVAHGAPVYAPGVIDVSDADAELVACYTPAGTAVCLGRLVAGRDTETGVVVDLERVLL